ncbi:hypothetical protein TI05_05810 [Achromatium sp. WMS3]|nr:hypothetical protein TI05_05810 [Achromatium sp. WMS3]
MKQIFLVLLAAFLMAFNLTTAHAFWGSGDTKAKTEQTQTGQKADDDDDAKPVASGQAVETGTQAATTEESDDDDKEDD